MAKRELAGSRAILTGASSGIGVELARELARHGVRLVLAARRKEQLEQTAQEVAAAGSQAVAVMGDIADPDVRSRLVDTAQSTFGGLDLLINNAGMGLFGPFANSDPARLRQIMEVNFFAPVELIRIALPVLRNGRKPMIVNVSSVLGHFAVPNKSEYSASKFALHGFSDALRMELMSDGIDVLLVSPSTTTTEFFDKAEPDANRRPQRGMSPTRVARKTVAAIRQGKHEVIFSLPGNLAVWGDRIAPSSMSRLLARFGD